MNNCMLANWITSELDKFLETENLSRMNHKEIKCIHMPITVRRLRTNQETINKEKLRIRGFHWRILPNI